MKYNVYLDFYCRALCCGIDHMCPCLEKPDISFLKFIHGVSQIAYYYCACTVVCTVFVMKNYIHFSV